MVPLLAKELEDVADQLGMKKDALDANAQLLAVRLVYLTTEHALTLYPTSRAFLQMMRVHSAEEAFLLMSYSSRTISDVKRAMDHTSSSPDSWGECLTSFSSLLDIDSL